MIFSLKPVTRGIKALCVMSAMGLLSSMGQAASIKLPQDMVGQSGLASEKQHVFSPDKGDVNVGLWSFNLAGLEGAKRSTFAEDDMGMPAGTVFFLHPPSFASAVFGVEIRETHTIR